MRVGAALQLFRHRIFTKTPESNVIRFGAFSAFFAEVLSELCGKFIQGR